MGGDNSKYVRIHITKTGQAASFAFNEGAKNSKGSSLYTKVTIYTHSDYQKKDTKKNMTQAEYDKLGRWYAYDGDQQKLAQIFCEFNPNVNQLPSLLSRLELECKMTQYETLWETIKSWIYSVYQIVGATVGLIGPAAMPAMILAQYW